MKKLALIHTVDWYPKVINVFLEAFLERHPGTEVIHIEDSSLLSDSLAAGAATPNVLRRIIQYAICAENAGADAVMPTCTTVNRSAALGREILNIPMINIDEPMANSAVAAGKKIGILATVPTSAPCTKRLLLEAAEAINKKVEVEVVINEEAFSAHTKGDIKIHDEIVCKELYELEKRVDAIALGQISLAQVEHKCKVPVFKVGKSGFDELSKILFK